MDSFNDRIELYSKKSNDHILDFSLIFLCILIILVVSRLLFFENVLVLKTSMVPTIADGQTVTIFKTKNVNRGDIVVFKDTDVYNGTLIKRVIGLENDVISIDSDGILNIEYENNDKTITHKAIKEDYILNGENIILSKYIVPTGRLFVLGDNRLISYDSSEFGAIKQSTIIGKVILK